MNAPSFHGALRSVRLYSGACAVRVSHAPRQRITEHRHDWATLTLPLAGSCLERHEDGEAILAGPSAALHAPGALHEDEVGEAGFETLSIQFDPAWLGQDWVRRVSCSHVWRGRQVTGVRALQRLWRDPTADERALAKQTAAFIARAFMSEAGEAPPWINRVADNLQAVSPKSTRALAAEIGVSSRWIAEAYRSWCGEGLADALMRRRVETALQALRTSRATLAEIAVDAGFCDQSHMNRCFQRTLDCTPVQARDALCQKPPEKDSAPIVTRP